MIYVRAIAVLARHAFSIYRAGQGRFRLETFGLYYPALPYSAPWWRPPVANGVLLIRRLRSYCRWIQELNVVRDAGAAGWWDQHYPDWKDKRDEWNAEQE